MNAKLFNRVLALLLCAAMVIPNLSGLALAADQSGSSQTAPESKPQEEEKWIPVVPEDIPVYSTAGEVSDQLENDCGNGLTQDKSKSYFRMVTGTTASEFSAYLTKLENAGFVKKSENRIAAKTSGKENISTRWLSPKQDYVLTVYYTPDYSEVKIVADTAEDIVKTYASGFHYEGGEAVTSVMMTMYGLSMSENGYDSTTQATEYNLNKRNCGALIVIRMPDNSLFVNDGGDLHQWSDEICAEFMEFCREITNTPAGEKVIFNSWFISHAHSDHFGGLPRFIDQYHDQIDIKNVMYSLDDEMIGSTRDMTDVLKMVKAYYPDVTYYKPHTGEHFAINGIEFDVLYTQEDRFYPAEDGSLNCGKVSSKLRENGTYRPELVESTNADTGAKEYDFNDTSTVLKVTFPADITGEGRDYNTILYADANLADEVILATLADSVLDTDIMMVPHHGHDAHPELVAKSGANIFLYTQHKQAIYGPDNDYTTVDPAGTFRPNLRNLFLEMQDHGGENYFDTTAARKTYWEGSESAVIFFGEDKTFDDAETLGFARDSEDPAGFTVYTKAAPNFEYEGWTLLPTVIGTDIQQTDKVTTGTNTIRGDAVEVKVDDVNYNTLISGEKYIIVHDKTNLVMNYNAMTGTDNPPRPNSLIAGTRPNVDKGLADIYFRYDNGTTYNDKLYFTQHMRDGILWEFSLADMFDKVQDSDTLVYTGETPQFGGVAAEYYYRSYWYKGVRSDEEVYWNTDPANADTAWRHLVPAVTDGELLYKFSQEKSYNTRVEFFVEESTTDASGKLVESCDTCVIYYSSGEDVFRFLTVDDCGNWVQKKYTSVDDVQKDLPNLKLRLYQYKELSGESDIKTVDSIGAQTYYVAIDREGEKKSEKLETVINAINSQLTVRDSYRRWMPIPCSGTTPVVGSYWLDGDLTTDSVKQSTIKVWYRNDDGTDTLVTTLTLHVVNEVVADCIVVNNGITDVNSGVTGNVFESRDDDGVVEDRVATIIVNTNDGYVRKDVSVNVGMLSYDADSTITVPGGMAVSAGSAGALVSTKVEAGTVYNGLSLHYQGMLLTDDFTLNVEEITQLDQPEYPDAGSIKVDKVGTAAGSSFFNTGIANVELSATGISEVSGVDLIITLDMSGSMTDAVSSTDPTTRLNALKDSMKSLMKTLQESNVNFRVAISDFGDLDHFMFDGAVADPTIREKAFFDTNDGTDWNDNANSAFGSSYEFYNHLNFVFSQYGQDIYRFTREDGTVKECTVDAFNDYIASITTEENRAEEKTKWTRERIVDFDNQAEPFERTIVKWNYVHNQYTGSLEPNVYTGSLKANAEAFVDVKSKTEAQWNELINGFKQGEPYLYGTNYDRGLEYMYQLGYAIQQENIDKGLDREVVAVFISDGAPMQYNYFSGRTTTPAWADWFTGRIDASKLQTNNGTKPAALQTLEDKLLLALKQKTTVRNIDFGIIAAQNAETLQQNAGFAIENINNDWVHPVTTPGDLSTKVETDGAINDQTGYFYLQWKPEWDTTPTTFYQVMGNNGIRLDAHMYDRIAEVNGIVCDAANMTKAELAEVDAQLFVLAKENKVVYPTAKRYLADENATDLYASLEAQLGYRPTFEQVLQIAYRTNNVTVGEETINFRDLLVMVMEEVTTLTEDNAWGTLSPYSYFYNEEGKNWWAEAIKGDPNALYPVINKYAYSDHESGAYSYYGTVRNYYSDGSGASWNNQDYMAGYRGLGIPIYTLGVSIGGIGYLSNEDTVTVLKNISSGETYAFSAYSGDDLNNVFATITASATNAATNAYFTDTMGEDYDLLTSQLNGVTPTIEVREYLLDKNHNRTGDYVVLESVTFAEDGVAKSTAVYDSVNNENDVPVISYPDIWKDNGLIDGKYFFYNTTSKPISVDLNGDGKLDTLEPETFYWILGTINTNEVVLSYQAYLTGSDPEDEAPQPGEGTYPTNESAILHYVNYRGRDTEQDTVSPEFPWGKARVGYGFYLVDESGNPIVNAITGETGSIQNAVKMTRPVYQNVIWGTNLTENRISSLEKSDVLPDGYLLYTTNVNYFVAAYSDGTGKWNFQSDPTNTTYVQYGNTYTNTKISDGLGLDNGQIHDTVVWFAVKRAAPLTTDKTVEQNGDNFTLTLEAFANGATSQVATVKPADVVLVLDQSSSMYTPLGWTKDRVNLEGGDTHTAINAALSGYKISNFAAQASIAGSEIQENAKRMGYYIAVHNSYDFMYLVHYAQNSAGKWGWYYISLDQTTRSIDMDTIKAQYNNPSTDSNLNGADYKAIVYNNNGSYDLLTNVSYYKTQYGALVESVESFVEGLKLSGVDHRLGIVGFASPFYDGWDNYDGSGLYIDGNFYLYDTDFMYKGTQSSNAVTYTEQGFVEENWTGNVILDPDKTFTNKVPTALSSAELQNAYANSIICKDANGNPTGGDMYGQALVSVTEDYDGILNSIGAINANYQQTCPSVGIEMAEKIFAARSAETAKREKIIVLFTDGVPTVRLYSNREHGFTNDIYAKSLYWSISGGVEDALDRAEAAKDNGVEIYTVGTAAMENSLIGGTNIDSGKFLDLLSSNYAGVIYGQPDASMISADNPEWQNKFDTNANGGEGLDKDPDPSNPVSSDRARYYSYYNGYGYGDVWTYYYRVAGTGYNTNGNYALFATAANGEGNDLNVAFGTVMESITMPTVSLDATAELRDVLSEYFELVGNDASAITVYTAPFNSDGTVGQMSLLQSAVVRLGKTDKNSNRYDIINVSGYDYHAEYYSAEPREKNGADYYGSKLIVKINVQPREGFWGGNNVPTNDPATGVYDNDGTKVQEFPIPEANVPVKPVIQAQDQVVYYGDTVITAMDLIERISAGNVAVSFDADTGRFIPAESWMDDFAVLSWTSGLNDHTTGINSVKSGSYTFGITMTPRPVDADTPRDGLTNMTEGDSNIAGTPVISVSSDTDTGNVDILVPVITYQDSNIKMGDETSADYYAANNRVAGIQWVNMDDPYGLDSQNHSTTPSDFSIQPSLSYTFTPVGKFTKDTPVDVEVYLGNSAIASAKMTEVCYFAWVNCASDLHDSYETPKDEKDGDDLHWHKGSAVSAEFIIHVIGADNGMVTNKFATPIEGTNDRFMLTLEAYATGSASTIQFTKPADIVLVLDHSGSMRTPVGADHVLESGVDTNTNTAGITPIDRSKLSVINAKHIGYYVAYNTADNHWYIMQHRDDLVIDGATVSGWRGYKVKDTEAIIDTTNPNPGTDYNQIGQVDWKGGTVPASIIFYKSQYAMLYDSVLSFVDTLKKSGVEHRVAIVGFAGSATFGTRLYCGFTKTDANGNTYIDETVKKYDTILNNSTTERQNELYRNAMKNVQDSAQYAELLSNIEAIETNYSFTCPAAGIDLGNKVMQANPVNLLDRDRIMVLFTDGIPNRKIGENDTGSDAQAIYEQVVGMAYYTKNGYGAEVYSISTSTLGSADRTFLSYLSSDYPNAKSYTEHGDPIAEPKFTKRVNNVNEMNLAFESVTTEVSSTTVPLDDTTVLMEILTDYVEFDNQNPELAVKVYKQLYNGDGTWGDRIELVNTDEHTYYELCSTNSERTDTVKVFGFHYSTEYISDVAREVDGQPYYGSKLVAEVYIKTRDGFWGGNNVPTNDAATGLYSDGERVESFPIPEVNVPIIPDIKVKDQVVYYGENGIHAGHLFQGVTVNGVDVLIDPETGKFLPLEGMEWVNDYADLSWITGEGFSNLDTPVSGTESGEYTFGVNMKPIYDGSGNAMGTAVPVEGIDVSDTAKVDVLVPVITFQDSTIAYGDGVNADYYNSTNLVGGITWVNKDDPYGLNPDGYPTTPSEDFNTAPDLSLDYFKVNGAGEYFTEDFKVDVQLSIGNMTITDESYFQWEDCENSQLHDQHETPANDRDGGTVIHKGSTDSHEFTVHLTCILEEDAVVIDFGIPVDISILLNDILPDGVTLEAVMLGNELPGVFSTTLSDEFEDSANCDYGALGIIDGKLRYTSANMQMKQSVKFIYAVKYVNGETVRYYYSSVTVIPATIIYYEDSFVKLDVVDKNGNKIEGAWSPVTDDNAGSKVQDEDRPGEDKNDALGNLDMDSIYGFDTNYKNFAQYSLGSAAKITVSAGRAGKASFSFWGTGFDVVSLSSCDTGTIVVKVTDMDGNYVVNYLVDTYYGYKFDGENWIVDTQAKDNALYQVPVIKVDLNNVIETKDNPDTTDVDETAYYGYGYYNVEIVASYAPLFDHGKCKCGTTVGDQLIKCSACANSSECSCTAETCAECFSYDFYLDAIRIYDPANDGVNDTVIKNAYIADGEYLPTYEELRNLLISKEEFNSLGNSISAGAIFIDGNRELTATGGNGGSKPLGSLNQPGVIEYANYGPNNELYLADNQAVAFKLNSVTNLNQVHMALKLACGNPALTVYGVDKDGKTTYIYENVAINSATDLYYNISALIGQTVVIRNTGDEGSMLSITNIKSTYYAEGTEDQDLMTVDGGSVNMALASLEGEKDPIVSEGVIAPQSATLTYEDEILLNIYLTMEGIEASELGLMTYTADGSTLLDTIPGAVFADGQYMATTRPIAAKNLGDTVYFRVYAKLADGSYVYSKLLSYSPKTYAMNILNNSDDVAMKSLVVAMLNYGAEAQKYFGYKTEALVNADLNAEQKALVADYSADMIAPLGKVDSAKVGAFAANGGFGKKYPTVSLEGAFAINYYFENSYAMNNGMTLYYWTAEDYAKAEVLTAENATGIVNGTTVSGIAAKDLDSTIYVAAVYECNGTSYCTGVLPYSIGAFCVSNGSALAQAIAVYGNYAQAYFG